MRSMSLSPLFITQRKEYSRQNFSTNPIVDLSMLNYYANTIMALCMPFISCDAFTITTILATIPPNSSLLPTLSFIRSRSFTLHLHTNKFHFNAKIFLRGSLNIIIMLNWTNIIPNHNPNF